MGYYSAKNNYKFLLISDTINKNDIFIRLYSDNEKNILSPYKIASNSIIIDNRQIIVKPNINISLNKIESKTIELILEPDGTINEQVLDRFSNSDK